MPPEVRPGDRFVVAADGYVAGVLTQWSAPFTDGGRREIPRGTVLVALDPVEDDAPGFGAKPEAYDALLPVLVDAADVADRRFAGYHLVCAKADVGGPLARLAPGDEAAR